ncbi:putative Beta-lactamase-related domain-containing protein [Seiridium cardinale]
MPSFDTILETAVAEKDIPGAVMLAKNKSGTFNFTKSIGLQSPLSDPSTPYNPSTVLELASMTKLVTSIASLQLVERGLVTLDQELASILPSFASQHILAGFDADGKPQLHKRQNPITLRYLLTHSAGAGYTFLSGNDLAEYRTRIQMRGLFEGATVDTRFDTPLLYEPGEGWAYSSSIDRAGQVIEKVSGLNLEEYLRTNVFEPLGISTGTFWPDKDISRESRAAITFRDPETGDVVEKPGAPSLVTGATECFGGQGLYMSSENYLKILYSILVDDGKLLTRETSKMMFVPQLTKKSKASLLHLMEDPSWAVGEFPRTNEYDWSFGGILVDGDSHEWRKRGTLIWGGAANLFWFIDREAGLCGVFGTQIYPAGDEKVRKVISAFEKEVYRLAASH